MSHNITQEDSLLLAKKKAWHGLGTILPEAPSLREALPLSGLDWTVEKVPVITKEEMPQEVPGVFAARRSDTLRIFGTVGKDYRVFQNADLFAFAQAVCQDSEAQVETVGSLRQGRDVFLLIQNDSFGLGRDREDQVHTYTLLRNTHDGSASMRVLGTSVRVVCNNTLSYALSQGKKSTDQIVIRHTTNLNERVHAAREALFASRASAYAFQEQATALAAKQLTSKEIETFFVRLYEKENGLIPVNPQTAGEHRKLTRAQGILGAWEMNLHDSRQTIAGLQGTAWSALNAATQWADHDRTVRVSVTAEDQNDARTFSNLFGTSAQFKATAKAEALALV